MVVSILITRENIIVVNDPPDDPGSPLGNHDVEPEEPEPRMIGDFDDGADDLWTLYGKVAKGYDEAQIQAMKEQMNDVFLFVRLYLDHSITDLGYADAPFPHRLHYSPPPSPLSYSTASRI